MKVVMTVVECEVSSILGHCMCKARAYERNLRVFAMIHNLKECVEGLANMYNLASQDRQEQSWKSRFRLQISAFISFPSFANYERSA